MDKALSELVSISNTLGRDRSLVVGTGGNTSVKTDDSRYMYIKASGTSLSEMNRENGWRCLRTESVLEIFKDKSLMRMDIVRREQEIVNRLLKSCDDNVKKSVRPSVESLLHVLLDRYVIHLHALGVLAYASAKNGRENFFRLFKDTRLPPLWINYADPGYTLSKTVFRQVTKYTQKYHQKPSIVVLEKHGLLVADNNSKTVMNLVKKVIKQCNAGLGKTKAAPKSSFLKQKIDITKRTIEKALLEIYGKKETVTHIHNAAVEAFAARENASTLLRAPAITPDEMGFLKSPVVWLKDCDYPAIVQKINACFAKGKSAPIAFLAKDTGLFVVGGGSLGSIRGEIIVGSLFVRGHAHDMGGINPLNKRQRDFINNWEGEKFRVQCADDADTK